MIITLKTQEVSRKCTNSQSPACQTISTKPKDCSFIINDKNSSKKMTVKKLETANF